VTPDTLPATGADARGLFGWVVALVVFGAGATVAGRRRELSARDAGEARHSSRP
jgi:LPXTG-motif cell wall-anchored protein